MTTVAFDKLRLASQEFENPRKKLVAETIRELALHIVRHGLLVPILAAPNGLAREWTVIGGQRRYRAIELIFRWEAELDVPDVFTEHLIDEELQGLAVQIVDRANELRDAVPIRMIASGSALENNGLALADNLMHEDLSSYEIAAGLAQLHDQGATGVELSRLIGKSPTYVSRKLAAWKGAGPELRAIWERGDLADDIVLALSEQSHAKQAKALAGDLPRRGVANRPKIDVVKEILAELEVRPAPKGAQLAVGAEARSIAYNTGVLDALRWVTGAQTSEDFVKLAGGSRE